MNFSTISFRISSLKDQYMMSNNTSSNRNPMVLAVANGGIPISIYIWLAQEAVFHGTSALFEWLDKTGTGKCFKIRAVDRKPYVHYLRHVLFNQFFILLPSMLVAEYSGLCFTGPAIEAHHWGQVLVSLVGMAIGHDIVQYITHRFLLHQPNVFLMRALRHSVHHSTGATKAISACYMSAPDFFLEIVLPYLIPLALVGGGGSGTAFHSLVAGLGAIGGLYEHSGYDLSVNLRGSGKADRDGSEQGLLSTIASKFLDNRSHAQHHVRGNVSFSDGFGSPGISDTIFGTRWDLAVKRRVAHAEKEWQRQRAELS
ncbi:unnamed protein product [Clonostachys byssicola]|uniref:Fatty acid hydroxylase domain-containing protein n=1 Tax=Clonostachys byssicola TaxID=160290 RepID=A0A9N9Y5J6_9HYPO|nr:unnamed protein product [Clonostachys byssicola]